MERLEEWAAEGRAALEGDRMTLIELGQVFVMKPAVHFTAVIGAEQDPANLVGLVHSQEDLQAMGADHMATSVIYGDTAYEVINGFLGEPLPP
ncbi:MAG: hypothetical protein IPI49_17050 [Myxococcales bacterium]|nr:hypothetical protein [Myxococcales bacterium]